MQNHVVFAARKFSQKIDADRYACYVAAVTNAIEKDSANTVVKGNHDANKSKTNKKAVQEVESPRERNDYIP